MSYTPTTWHKGDKVTAEKLNKIEQGIVDAEQSGGGLQTLDLEDAAQLEKDGVTAIAMYDTTAGEWVIDEQGNNFAVYSKPLNFSKDAPLFVHINGNSWEMTSVSTIDLVGSVTDPNTGNTEALYPTKTITATDVEDVVILVPNTDDWAIGHFDFGR